jgi:hypothetical protein
MLNPKIQLEQHIPSGNTRWDRGKLCDSRTYYRIVDSPSTRPLVAEQDGEGWLERFAQAAYDRGRADERAMLQTEAETCDKHRVPHCALCSPIEYGVGEVSA